ncbi:MAG: membrane protein insertase YidC, partial [Paramuribaculum sp.]|nr:membrane protein insertase YidC [Paramuribaculum sp.]
MDKNTITGLLLMAAVVLGFMWLNKPSEEELARQREAAEMQARAESEKSDNGAVLTVDSVSAAEIADITATIRQYGRQ